MIRGSIYVGLSDLLDQDSSSYEYYYSLPKEIQDRIKEKDLNTFEDMQEYVSKIRGIDSEKA